MNTNDVIIFMCSESLNMERLSKLFPLVKKITSSRIRFVLNITGGDGNIIVLFIMIACYIHFGIMLASCRFDPSCQFEHHGESEF